MDKPEDELERIIDSVGLPEVLRLIAAIARKRAEQAEAGPERDFTLPLAWSRSATSVEVAAKVASRPSWRR
jgi:hypothetical protein